MKILRLPGLIDIHVHLRDPGETQKEDFYTGTLAALAGGITTVFDMPNNKEPVFTYEKLSEKISIAKSKAVCDFGLYFGSLGDNTSEFVKAAEIAIGLKVYLSETTGKYVVADPDKIEKIFNNWPKQKTMVFHAVDKNIDLVIKLTEKYNNKVHITHVTTRNDLEKIIDAKKSGVVLTCDVTPHHLFLIKNSSFFIKPPLATQKDQDFLWNNLKWVDCIASDHAPHTIEEKKSENPPAGVPGLETMLPLMLNAVSEGRIPVKELVRLTSVNPAIIFNIKIDESTFVDVDTEDEYRIENDQLYTKCAWSPYTGWTMKGKIVRVYLHGNKVFEKGKLLVSQGFGNHIS